MLAIKKLHKSFGKHHVLKDITLELSGQQGIISILGPNGSGKTTLLKCILGLTSIDSGDILMHGSSIKGRYLYRKEINHLPQIASFPDNLTPRELISMIRDLRGPAARDHELIDTFSLEDELDKKMATLSGGNKQKVNLVLALMYDNPILILDEPTSGLDPLAILNLKKLLKKERERGKLILITTHIMDLAEDLSDHTIYLLEGAIYYNGTTGGLLEQQKVDTLEQAIAVILSQDTLTENKG